MQRVVKVDRFRVEVVLRTREAVERFRASTDLPFLVRGKTFTVSYFGRQNICLRVHWLPVIINNDVLHEVFSSFEKVSQVDFENHGDYENGVRRVFVEVSIAEKLEIPHMLQFADDLKALVTMSGRAPLCLQCGEVGHVRQACPPLRSNPGAARVTEAQDQRSADAPVPAPRQVEALETPVTATPVEMAHVVATPAATAPAATAPVAAVPAATAPSVATPAAGKEDAKYAVESDTSGEDSDMEWVEVRRRRRSRSSSTEGRRDCVKKACGFGEEITPLLRNRYRSELSSGAEPEITFSDLFTADFVIDDLLATQSPHH